MIGPESREQDNAYELLASGIGEAGDAVVDDQQPADIEAAAPESDRIDAATVYAFGEFQRRISQ